MKIILKTIMSSQMPFTIFCLAFFISTSILITPTAKGQYIHAVNQKIVDENNDELILRGIGLGGWMLQEGYMLRTSGPQHEIEGKIQALIGAENTKTFYDAWLANHCTKADIDSMASWGFNSVRLPMHYKLFTPSIQEESVQGQITWNDKGFEMVDNLLAWLKANNMYLILDLHATPGGQGENADISDYDRTKPSLWESEANQDKMVALWVKLADRYKNEPNIGAYDIINEPNWGFQNHASDLNGCAENQNTALWNLQKRITTAIREVDTNHMIIIEGNCWGNNYGGLPTLWDNNMAISYHKYWNGNDTGAIQGMLNMRTSKNVPIWLGETGENSNTWFTDAIDLFETNKMGWSWWPLKKMGGNNPLQVEVNTGYQKILDYWSSNTNKPSTSDAFSSLMELTENLKIENNTFHPDVVDAMIRQPHSDDVKPFKKNVVTQAGSTKIFASDYDFGKNGIAYFDNDATNESGNAGGVTWNKGYAYRNDGVDIEPCQDQVTNGYNVGWTEDGEWMQYTLDVETAGAYLIDLKYATSVSNSSFQLSVNDTDVSNAIVLPASGGYQKWVAQSVQDVVLYQGMQRVKIKVVKGGFNINYLEFTLKKNINEVSFVPTAGESSTDGKELYLYVNKLIDVDLSSFDGFELSVDGATSAISTASVDPSNSQRIILTNSVALTDINALKLNYTGTGVVATDGTALDVFSDLSLTNHLPIYVVLPAKIEAESFVTNNGLVFEVTTDTGGGQNAGYTDVGDYLDYHISVNTTGYFLVEARVASNSAAGTIELQQLDQEGQMINSARIEVLVTGGWQTWKTYSTTMQFTAGRGILRVKIIKPGFNFNWLNFKTAAPPPVIDGINDNKQGSIQIYPNPAHDKVNVVFPSVNNGSLESIVLRDLSGRQTPISAMKISQFHYALEVSVLPMGIYVLELNNSRTTWRERILIN